MDPVHEATRPPPEGTTPSSSVSTQGLYTSLPPNTIRLLRLSQVDKLKLQGDLILARLAHGKKYTALSYTWGEKQGSEILVSNKGTIPLSQNLSLALKALTSGPDVSLPLLWIDQICIDQRNEREKQQQIEMMGEIYSEATEVMVWLGAEGDIEHLSQLSWAIECLQTYEGSKSVGYIQDFLVGQATNGKQPSLAEKGFSGLLQLWCRPWFERLWVRQEVALAKGVVFHCGSNMISAAKLAKACEIQLQAAYHVLSGEVNGKWTGWVPATAKAFSQLTRAHELFELVESTQPRRIYEREDLLNIFRFSFNLKAKEGCDRLYAIYHLSSAATKGIFSPVNKLTIDRLWQELAVYLLSDVAAWNESQTPSIKDTDRAESPPDASCMSQDTAATAVESTSSSEKPDGPACPAVVLALPCTQEGTDYQSPPTWVPQFDKLGYLSAHKFDYYFYYSRHFAAGGKGSFNPIFEQDQKHDYTLKVEGILLSQVVSVMGGTQQPSLGELEPQEFESEEYWIFIREELVPWYLRCRTYAKGSCRDFAKLLRQGIDNRWEKGSKSVPKDAKKPDLRKFLVQMERVDLQKKEKIEMYSDLLPFMVSDAWRVDCRDRRRIIAVLSDKRKGWVPESTLIGDHVILISGAPFPFVVRTTSTHDRGLHIIGDAYFEGLQSTSVWRKNQDQIVRFIIG